MSQIKYHTLSIPFFASLVLIAVSSCGETNPAPKPDAMSTQPAKPDAPTDAVLRDALPDKISSPEHQLDTAAVAPDVSERDSPQAVDASVWSDTAVITDTRPASFADTTIDSVKQDSGRLSDTPVANPDSPRVIDSLSSPVDIAIVDQGATPDQQVDTSFADTQIDTASADTKDAGCSVGLTRESYSGLSGTAGVGICRSQLEACDEHGTYVVSRNEVTPQKEIPWDGIDQDCNGSDLQCPVYVGANNIDAGVETGSPTSPWRTIQAAFDQPTICDTVVVKRGTYHETISCDGCEYSSTCGIKTLKSEEGAGVTTIDLSSKDDTPYQIELYKCSITIDGFTIANSAVTALDIYAVSKTTIVQHNIFLHNNIGIAVSYGPGDGSPIIIRNNIIIGNPTKTTWIYDRTGIELRQSGGLRRVENNLIIGNQGTSDTSAGVFIDNWSTGYVENNIIMNGYHGILRYYDYNTTTSRYNCLFGNYTDYVKYEPAGLGDVRTDPKLIGPISGDVGATTDFHLSPDSPCRNAGNPEPAYNDVDGTRNDIGPYGGPFGKW